MDPGQERALKKARPHKRKGPAASHPNAVNSTSISVNALKSKIRDVRRVLEHAQKLPLDVRIEKERALAGYSQDLEKAENEKETQRMIKKYHMVRFFERLSERQKATRNLKKLRTRSVSAIPDTPEFENLAHQVHCAEVDLNYTLYHPLAEKYIGIFPRQDTSTEQDHLNGPPEPLAKPRQNRPAMWTAVEACMSNGTLEELRNGKLQTNIALRQQLRVALQKNSRRKLKEKDRTTQVVEQSGRSATNGAEGESDGGFFEE
ncbi:MAG: hypothetical protein Q9208_003870 [Pyrenodesmia sp. 3 TL-2023]